MPYFVKEHSVASQSSAPPLRTIFASQRGTKSNPFLPETAFSAKIHISERAPISREARGKRSPFADKYIFPRVEQLRRSGMRFRFLPALLAALLLAALFPPAPAYAEGNALYETEEINEYSMWFTNRVDGYRLMVERDMEADMSIASVRTVLRCPGHTIEIYPLDLGSIALAPYVSYSNRFAKDSAVFTVLSSGRATVAGRTANVLEWYRPPLAGVEGGCCYYAAVDLELPGSRGLSFLFKSTERFEQFGSKYYTLVLNTLRLVPATAAAPAPRTAAVPNPHWNTETREYFASHFGPSAGLTWGMFFPSAPDVYDDAFRALETGMGHRFSLLLRYCQLDAEVAWLLPALENAAAENRTLELTLQTSPDSGGGNMLLDALAGTYDGRLAEYARAVAAHGKPVLFRLCNEMNGDWCVYSAAALCRDAELYVEFYRYVYRIFEENGALANTIWVWNPNERSYPDFPWNHTLCYYPGDAYVDVVGMTGYNTGTYYASYGERWRSFAQIYDGLYAQYTALFAQPLMITEFACSDIGGDKAGWVADMLSRIGAYPGIKAAVWWDGCDYDAAGRPARPYALDGNALAIEYFRNYFAAFYAAGDS